MNTDQPQPQLPDQDVPLEAIYPVVAFVISTVQDTNAEEYLRIRVSDSEQRVIDLVLTAEIAAVLASSITVGVGMLQAVRLIAAGHFDDQVAARANAIELVQSAAEAPTWNPGDDVDSLERMVNDGHSR